jgi:D-sedoheptulose 7-phosphate isomerase
MKEFYAQYNKELNTSLEGISHKQIEELVDMFLTARKTDNQIFVIGNGGSAANASHMACDITKCMLYSRDETQKKRTRFRITSLNDNVPIMTAWSNDTSYDHVFSKQLEALANPGDIIVAISASGNSSNILNAVSLGKEMGCKIIALSGFSGGNLKGMSDLCLIAQSDKYDVVEDTHSIISHIITRWLYEKIKD